MTDSIVARARAALKADSPSTRLAVHPDGTPMVSIGEAADLDTIARLAADPEHSRKCMTKQQRKGYAAYVQSLKDAGTWNAIKHMMLPGLNGPLNKVDLEQIWQEEQAND